MTTFVIVALLVWTGMNGYVGWRLGTLAALVEIPRWPIWTFVGLAWISFPIARGLRNVGPALSGFLETASTTWLGVLFLLCFCLLVVDVVTLGGLAFRDAVLKLRTLALVVAAALSIVALIQGKRDPVVRPVEIILPGLPKARDGLRMLLLSDMHLGTQIKGDWIQRLVSQTESLKPDFIAIAGDTIDHDVELVQPMLPELKHLQAPLGVWVALGNHEAYSGSQESVDLLRRAGFRVLLDESAEITPGLRIVGVQDLGVRRRYGQESAAVKEALKDTGAKGTEGLIFLSHTPEMLKEIAAAGVGLMLCGHTHGGQIWPFNYLVASRYPTIAGRYDINGMTLFVSRGAGTWGPRMRLWKSGEIYLITLRSPSL